MGGRASKADPSTPPFQPPSTQQVKEAEAVIKEKGGKALDPDREWNFKEERKCTDVLCWLVFLIFQGAVLVIAGFGYAYGDPIRLIYGYDFLGKTCGSLTGPNFNKTNLYYPYPIAAYTNVNLDTLDMSALDLSWSICMDSCPFQTPSISTGLPNMCTQSFQVMTANQKIVTCGGGVGGTTDMSQFGSGASTPDEAKKLLGLRGYLKYCLPNVPLCPCSNGSVAWDCCDGTKAQAIDSSYSPPRPMVQQLTSARSLLGVTVGYQYGFCFIPYPSAATSFTARCLPSAPATPTLQGADTQTGAGGQAISKIFTDNLNQIGSVQTEMNPGSPAVRTIDEKDVATYLTTALKLSVSAAGSSQETFNSLCAEVYDNRWVIMGSALLALLCSLLYTQLLRYYAQALCVVVLALCWALLAMCTAVLGYKAGIINSNLISQKYTSGGPTVNGDVSLTPSLSTNVGQADMNRNLLIIATVVVGVTFVVYTCVVCWMYRRLMLAAEVVSEAGRCVAAMPLVLLFPLAQWILIAAYFVWFVILFLYLASAGTFNQTTRKFEWDDQVRRCIILHMFAMLWARAMILAGGNVVVATATAQWFLAPREKVIFSPMLVGTRIMVRYHLGTVFFGSAIVATIQFFRFLVQAYLYGVSRGNEQNSLVAALKVIGACCLACMERFFNFVNKNAFIQTAIEGTNFCTSAKNAYELLLRNMLRLAAICGLSTVFLWIGKILVAVMTAFISALIIMQGDIHNVTQAPIFSVTVITLMAFAIGSAFMDAWEIVIDTLFQCFCMDQEKGAGKTHLSFKAFVDENKPKSKDLNMVSALASTKPKPAQV